MSATNSEMARNGADSLKKATGGQSAGKPRKRSKNTGPVGYTRKLAYLLLLPAFISVAFLLAYPLYLVFSFSLNERVGINFLQTKVMNLKTFPTAVP